MTKGFYRKLAADNIKKNQKTYIPYILTCIVTTAMFYIVKSLSLNPGIKGMAGDDMLRYLLGLGTYIIALFAFIFLFYTNSFLIKRRKKEFGLFNILGMEKRHISKVLGWETVYASLVSFAGGFLLGIVFDKVMFLLIARLIDAEISLGFFISAKAIRATLLLFAAIFILIYLNALRQIHVANPIDLLRAGNQGEKEPKTKWLIAALGAVCLGTGYYLAITTENPIASIPVFFTAVLLVIAGTYLLFTAGSIALLKLLRKNKRFYYHPKHFTSISGMIYRMKQNAVGLANICILSTMVLVIVSSTTSLMIGIEDILNSRYPYHFTIQTKAEASEDTFDAVRQLQKEKNLHVTEEVSYTYLQFAALRDGSRFYMTEDSGLSNVSSINTLFVISLTDYNRAMGEDKTLEKGEALLYSKREPIGASSIDIFGETFSVKETLDAFVKNGNQTANLFSTQCMVVPDIQDIGRLYELQEKNGASSGSMQKFYGFDTDEGEEEQLDFREAMLHMLAEQDLDGRIETSAGARQSFISLYGGFFFIGIFLGFLFIMAAVLIIYYKQISEGYDDKERFEIMQKVGMSLEEVKSSIRSQVLTVFFLPLIAAGCHVAAAFPLISKLLLLFDLANTSLYITCTVICFLIFSVMYVLIYTVTARNYYKIVKR